MAADTPERKLARAKELLGRGKPRKALDLLDAHLHASPGDVRAILLRGHALWDLDMVEEAEGAYEAAVRAAPDLAPAHVARVEIALDGTGDPERALALAREGQKRVREAEGRGMLIVLEAEALIDLERGDEALRRIDEALRAAPEFADARALRASILFERFDLDGAEAEAGRALGSDSACALAHHVAGCVHEWRGRHAEARAAFARAHEIDPEGYPRPVCLSDAEFDRAVEEALEQLPDEVSAALENVVIERRDLPDEATCRRAGEGPQLLGLFEGFAVGEETSLAPSGMPPRITLFKRNIEKLAGSKRDVIEQVRITIFHEVAHRIGFDEEGVDELGLG